MNGSLATLIYACGIAGLFYLDRDKTLRTSKALWLPVMWLWIVGSRGPSVWLGIAPPTGSDIQLEGRPLDRLIFTALVAVALVVVIQRGRKAIAVLSTNWSVLVYFVFALVSIAWSDYPDVAFKRWTKAIGDLLMVLIVLTDFNPTGAFKRTISRVGFILLPASLLLIKYFPVWGRAYDPWHGTQINTGVTTNKNLLGVIVMVISLGALWRLLTLVRDKSQPNRRRHLLAQAALLAFGIALLVLADSATSRAGFALGALLMVATSTAFIKRHPRAVHALMLTIVIVGAGAMLSGGGSGIVQALGRKSDFTGRTEIWEELIPMVPNPVVGAGFESFWLGSRLAQIWAANPGNPLNEAHNGYLEIYLNLGWVGVALIALILISGYWRAALAFRRDPGFSSLLLAYVAVAAIYSITEAGFRILSPMWIFFLFAVVASSALASGKETVAVRRFGATADGLPNSRERVPLPILKKPQSRSLDSADTLHPFAARGDRR